MSIEKNEVIKKFDEILKECDKKEVLSVLLEKFTLNEVLKSYDIKDVVNYCSEKVDLLKYVKQNYEFQDFVDEFNADMHDILDYVIEEFDEKEIITYIQSSKKVKV